MRNEECIMHDKTTLFIPNYQIFKTSIAIYDIWAILDLKCRSVIAIQISYKRYCYIGIQWINILERHFQKLPHDIARANYVIAQRMSVNKSVWGYCYGYLYPFVVGCQKQVIDPFVSVVDCVG